MHEGFAACHDVADAKAGRGGSLRRPPNRERARLRARPPATVRMLLQRSPNILLIPGTLSVEHLRENVAGAGLQLPHEAIKELNHAALRQSKSRAHY
jgi:diketogulonate reductase-like aldo/keto reductase